MSVICCELRGQVLAANLRECWILTSNRKHSCTDQAWTKEPTIHSIVVEWVWVDEKHRRQGHLKRFLAELCADPRFEMVVVEAVQNPILQAALLRWGWECNPSIMDFYKETHRGH